MGQVIVNFFESVNFLNRFKVAKVEDVFSHHPFYAHFISPWSF